MQYQRGAGPKPRIVRRGLERPTSNPKSPVAAPAQAQARAPELAEPDRTGERPTVKSSLSSAVPSSARWLADDALEDDRESRPTLESVRWEADEPITAQRSVPRMALPSWDTVDPSDLIPTIPPPGPAPEGSGTPAAPTQRAALHPPSDSPVALEVEEDAAPISFHRGISPLWGLLVVGGVAAAVMIAIPGAAPGTHSPSPAPAVEPLMTTLPPREEDLSVPPPVPLPEDAPPLATTGTVVGSAEHRLFVDGRLAPGWKIEVKCGTHTVKNGSRGVERTVNVPCGGEVEVVP
jgi:hypothetical protein